MMRTRKVSAARRLTPTLDDETGARHSVPSPLVGEGQGGGDCRISKVGVPPTPSPSPQGGGESAQRLPKTNLLIRRPGWVSFVSDPLGLTPLHDRCWSYGVEPAGSDTSVPACCAPRC